MLGIIVYFFPDLALYFAISMVLFMVGHPLSLQIRKLHIGKHYIGKGLAAVATMVAIALVISLFLLIIIPLVNKQAAVFTKIDSQAVMDYFKEPITNGYDFLLRLGLVSADGNVFRLIEDEINALISWTNVSSVFSTVVSTTSNLVVGLFSVTFLTFFLLRDPKIIHNIIMAVTPENYEAKMDSVLSDTRVMLTRYFFGLMIEVVCMMFLITLGLTVFGIKNALIIGFLGGLMNVIPYLGPLMGASLGTVLGVVTALADGAYSQIMPNSLAIIGVFVAANLVDNFVLQPLIYSKSVIAHPIEIFLVILMAGKIGGVLGMIVAIPSYTVIRIVAKQFLGQFKFVELLTKDMAFNVKDKKTPPNGEDNDAVSQ